MNTGVFRYYDKTKMLSVNFSKLQADVKVAKNINNLVSQRVVDLERQCWALAQYSSRECLGIIDILCYVDDNSFREKVN